MTLLRSLHGGFGRAGIYSLRCSTRSQRGLSTTNPAPETRLAGTAPAHRCYIFLHTPQPPSAYPAKYTTPIERKLLLATTPWGGSVNFSWSPSQPVHPHAATEEHPQAYHLTAFSSARGKLEIDTVSLMNVEDVGRALQAHAEPHASGMPLASSSNDVHLYVCTHGARDCRCGDTGGAVVRAILAELDRRRQHDASDPSTRVKVAEVAHVGGHKYAANVLVYPHGEWLGNVEPEHVPEMIDAILARPIEPMRPGDMPICPTHWRGRMGLSKEEQMELFSRFSTT